MCLSPRLSHSHIGFVMGMANPHGCSGVDTIWVWVGVSILATPKI